METAEFLIDLMKFLEAERAQTRHRILLAEKLGNVEGQIVGINLRLDDLNNRFRDLARRMDALHRSP